MIATVLFLISIVALAQFALFYWRALVAGVAAQPVSEQLQNAVGLHRTRMGPADFHELIYLNELTPGLREQPESLSFVRFYYLVMERIRVLATLRLPQLATWANREMAVCAQYVAVRMDQRLARNLACAAEIRSC